MTSVLRGAPGLRLRLLPIPLPFGSSMRSKRLRPGLTAVSKGLRVAVPRPRIKSMLGAVGRRVRRMGWPAAFAPSNSRMARLAEEMLEYVTKAVPEERPARSKRMETEVTGAMRVKRSWRWVSVGCG